MSEAEVEVEAEGRGAWTLRGKENGMTSYGWVTSSSAESFDGASNASEWHNRVRRGVRAIDQLLTLAGYPGESDEPIFGDEMKHRALAFQGSAGIKSTYGYVGPITMTALVIGVAKSAALEVGIAPRWVLAMVQKESGFDPGAQGWSHAADSGLVQYNVDAGSVSLAQAYDPVKSIRMAAHRWAAARDTYLADGADRQTAINAAVAQHNSPVWAAQWAKAGEPPNSQIAEYVALTREYAQDWRKKL